MIRAAVLALALGLSAAAAGAEVLPALFGVTGVAADDVLNIRRNPDAASPVIGTLPPDATGIEVVGLSPDGAWGRVNAGEAAGYVALRFLHRIPAADWTALTTPLRCLGTEPFWGLGIDPAQGTASLSSPDQRTALMQVMQSWPGSAARPVAALVAEGMSVQAMIVIRQDACSDGMSDQSFGLRADLFLKEGQAYSGCCSIAR